MSETPVPAVLSERCGHVLEITLNRPEKKNPFNPEMLVRLADLWDELDEDPDLRVAIVTGAGGNLSAGADLDRLVGALLSGEPPENEFEARLQEDLSLICKGFLKEHQPVKPIIAAVEVYCYAGGTEILQAFDIRVAGENAQIAISEVQRGLFPMSASTIRLPRQIPYTVANGPLAVRGIKEPIRAASTLPEEEAFAKEMEIGMVVMASKDAREGPKAFLEKRKPNFTGE